MGAVKVWLRIVNVAIQAAPPCQIGDDGVQHQRTGRGRAQPSVVHPLHHAVAGQVRDALGVEGLAGQVVIALDVQPFAQTQAHQQHFVGMVFQRQGVVGDHAVVLGFHQLQPRFGVALVGGGAAAVVHVEPPMGAGADACPGAAAPIGQVMPAFAARHGVVGNLVGGQATVGGYLLRQFVEIGGMVGVGHGNAAPAVQVEEGRALFDGQLVERQVVGGEVDGLVQFGAPRTSGLVRAGIDHVEGQARECRAGQIDGRAGLRRIVQPAEKFQLRIVQRLHPQRQPVHPGRAIARKAPCIGGRRVALHGDLDAVRHGPCVVDRAQDRLHRRRFHQGRRAAAEEDRRDGAPRLHRRHVSDLAGKGGRETG